MKRSIAGAALAVLGLAVAVARISVGPPRIFPGPFRRPRTRQEAAPCLERHWRPLVERFASIAGEDR